MDKVQQSRAAGKVKTDEADVAGNTGKAASARAASPPAAADATAAPDVLELLHAITHLQRARQLRALRDGAHGVTAQEARALGFFVRQPGATLSALAAHSGRDKAQLARIVKALRDRALLAASADPADRRSVRLVPTAAGRALHRALWRHASDAGASALACLTAAEQARLAALLVRVHAALQAQAEGSEAPATAVG